MFSNTTNHYCTWHQKENEIYKLVSKKRKASAVVTWINHVVDFLH